MVLSVELGGWPIIAARRTRRWHQCLPPGKTDVDARYEFTGKASLEKFLENIETVRKAVVPVRRFGGFSYPISGRTPGRAA